MGKDNMMNIMAAENVSCRVPGKATENARSPIPPATNTMAPNAADLLIERQFFRRACSCSRKLLSSSSISCCVIVFSSDSSRGQTVILRRLAP
jgi:hypothetical protein